MKPLHAQVDDPQLTVLVVGQTPPPVHGQSVMIASLMAGDYRHARLVPLRMAFSRWAEEVGYFSCRKISHLGALIVRTYALAMKRRPEVLYYHPGGSGRSGLLRDMLYLWAVRWLFAKTVLHFHAAGFEDGLSRLPRLFRGLLRRACDRPDTVVCVARSAPDPGVVLRAKRSRVVLNGIPDPFPDEPMARPVHTGAPRILFLGRLCEGKGVEVLLDAAAQLHAAGYVFSLTLAGPAESDVFAQTLRDKVVALELESHVALPGEVAGEDKTRLLQEADLLCLPTHYREELLPVVIIEAMAAGLPVVSTRWRGIPELVEDGVTGLLVETRDSTGLAGALAVLLKDSGKRQRFGVIARERFLANLTEKAYHRAIDSIFAEL